MDPRLKHPFTCIVAGPTGCGKTTFVTRLLRNASTMIDPSHVRVTWYYGEWQSAYENLDIPNLHLEEGLPTSFDASKRNIVVLDDLMAETDERVTNQFTKKSHHCNTSVIYPVQNMFPKNKESRTISLNSQYIVVFKNPRDVSQMTTFGQTDVPRSSQVCSGGVRRCDVNSLLVYFGRSETGHPRGSTLAHVHTTGRRCSVCVLAKSINSRAPCVTPYSTMSLHVTCRYWYNAELRKAQSLEAVLVGELWEAAYGRFDAQYH